MKKIALFLTFCILGFSNVLASTAVVNKVFPSTVLIVAEDKNAQPQSLGSGFLVSPNIVATNYHVIENSYSGYVKLVNQDTLYEIEGVVGYDVQKDLALIKISNNTGKQVSYKSSSVDIGQKIFAIGNPLGLEGTISDGIVSGLRNVDGVNMLQISAPISPGNSGGPVVDENGDVIGVATYTYAEGQNLNFAVPVKYVRELLANQSPLVSLSSLVKTTQSSSPKNSKDFKGVSITKPIIQGCNSTYINKSQSYDACEIEFSLKNNLRQGVHSINTLMIIYDTDNEVLDYKSLSYFSYMRDDGTPGRCIKPKLATREAFAIPKDSVSYLYNTSAVSRTARSDILNFIEFRILDFELCD